MHTKMIKEASLEKLQGFMEKHFSMLKTVDHKLYEEAEMELYTCINGYHFNDWFLDKAVNGMVNEDNTKGPHWSVDQTNGVAQSLGIRYEHFNQYDFNYVMNMLYSDLYGSINASVSEYGKMALKWLSDKDAKDGKAFRYYWYISKR